MSCQMSFLWASHFIPSQQQLPADTSLTLNSTEDLLDCFPVDLHGWRRICHLHMGKLFVPTYGQRETNFKDTISNLQVKLGLLRG